jgi:hypothetical protein
MMQTAKLSITSLDMPSPMIVVIILALKLPIDASFATRNASLSHGGDVNFVLSFSIPLKTSGSPSSLPTPPPARFQSRFHVLPFVQSIWCPWVGIN